MTRVVIAPDSFKGSAPARQVAQAVAAGWVARRPGDEVRLLPMADGGEGTLDALEYAIPGARREPITVCGPDGRDVPTYWLRLPDGTGAVELANTSGLTLLRQQAPMDADTLGFGQAITAAVDAGVDGLLLAIGGSASTDLGAGALTALGATLLDRDGRPIARGNTGLAEIATADLSGLRALPQQGAQVLSDVTSPLLGPLGAAAVFGPQKGADAATVRVLERNLAHAARLLPADPDAAGTGAAGGTGFGLLAWGATIVRGSQAIADVIGLPAQLTDADVVITGEGRYDDQSGYGKVAGHVAALAAAAGLPALLVAGHIAADTSDHFAAAQSLVDLAGDTEAAMADPAAFLRQAGARLADSYERSLASG